MKKIFICSLVFSLFLFFSCSKERNEQNKKIDNISQNNNVIKKDKDKYGDLLIEGSISDANNLIPIIANDLTSQNIASLVYNGLVKYDKDLNIVGDLAEKWDISGDNKEITFYLHKNVKWHDEVPFNADDVIFTYKTIIDNNTPTPYDGDFRKISKIEKIDNYTVKVVYDKPYAPALASWAMSILPKHLLEGTDITKSVLQRMPIGTGPFKFEKWNSGSSIELKANYNYFSKAPYLNGYILKIIPDSTSMFMELLKNKIDLMELTPIQFNKQTDSPRFTEHFNKYTYLSDTYTFIGYNLKNEIFKDKKVRYALTYATPKKEIISGILLGLGQEATGPYKPGTFWYNNNVKTFPYDLDKSNKLLDEAGYIYNKQKGIRIKNGIPLKFTIITNQGNDNRRKVAEILQENWSKIGVKVDIRILEWATFINEYINKRNFDAVVLAWTIVPDPDLYDVWHSSRCKEGGLNFTCYENPDLDKLIEKGRETLDKEERRKIYFKIQEILAEEQPYTFLYIPDALVAIHKRFKNIQPAPAGIKYNIEDWFVPETDRIYKFVP
jgi:peptide/nickel transport system substrate-binding protein